MPLARLFDDANQQYLVATPAILTAVPATLVAWFNVDNVTAGHVLVSLGSSIDSLNFMYLAAHGVLANDPVIANSGNETDKYAKTSVRFLADTWHHAAGVFATGSDRRAYIDGGGKGTNSKAQVPTNLDRTSIGVLEYKTVGLSHWGYVSGAVDHAAIWNVALTDAEVLWLARGRHGDGRPVLPPDVRPHALVGYWPLDGDDQDYGKLTTYHMTPTNTPTWTGGPPRLIDTSRRRVWRAPAVAAARKQLILGGGILG